MNLMADESIFLGQAVEAFCTAFMEEPQRFADPISEEIRIKDFHIKENYPWLPDYVIDITKLKTDDMQPDNPKYLNTARIYYFQEQYYVEKLIRNNKIMDVPIQEIQHLLRILYQKGIGVRLSASSIYIWNGHVKFRTLYPSFVAPKEDICSYYVERLAKLYHLEPEEIMGVLKCGLF